MSKLDVYILLVFVLLAQRKEEQVTLLWVNVGESLDPVRTMFLHMRT